jgi:hypothetical protein
MSDKPLSDDDAIRQQLRATNDKRRQESQRRAEEVQLQYTVEKIINDLFRAVADAGSHSENASWRGQPFDPRPHVPLIAAQLREVLNVLQQARRLDLLDDIDLDATCKHYCGQMDFQRYPKDDCRKALDLAVMNIRAAASGRADFDQLVTEVFFDSSVEPAGKWFQMLLNMVGGKLRFEGKVKPVDPAVLQVGASQGEKDGADRAADQGGRAELGEQRVREPDPALPSAVVTPPPDGGGAIERQEAVDPAGRQMTDTIPYTSPLSAPDLARMLRERGYSRATDDAVSAFLSRYRQDYPDCYDDRDEGERRGDRRRTEPRYVYRREVWPVLVRHFGPATVDD